MHDGSARVPGYGEGSAQRLPKYVRVYAVLARGAKSQRNADQRLLQSDCARRPAARRTVLSVSNGARAASQNPVWCRCATGWQVQTPQPHRLRLPYVAFLQHRPLVTSSWNQSLDFRRLLFLSSLLACTIFLVISHVFPLNAVVVAGSGSSSSLPTSLLH